MITKLKLTNFKSFKHAEIAFGPVSILVGANATGKSNIRDALRFLHGVARGYNLAEILGEKYGEGGQLQWNGIRGGTREVCFAGENSFSLEVEVEYGKPAVQYSYKISVHCGGNGFPPKVLDEQLFEAGLPLLDPLPEGTLSDEKGPGGKEIYLRPMLFDWALFSSPETAANAILEELESIRFIDFSPELMRKPSIPGQEVLSDRGENLSSALQMICEKPESKLVLCNWLKELTPMDVVNFEFVQDAAGKILVYLVEENGCKVSANSASDGTLRFLGMLAALLGPRPARFYFLEEIDNGYHPARLALLMDLLDHQSRSKIIQIAATTHSPQVLQLIKSENLKYATLAYRLKGSAEARLKALPEIPHLLDVVKRKDIARLHESAWMEQTMEFSEGSPKAFPLEGAEGAA